MVWFIKNRFSFVCDLISPIRRICFPNIVTIGVLTIILIYLLTHLFIVSNNDYTTDRSDIINDTLVSNKLILNVFLLFKDTFVGVCLKNNFLLIKNQGDSL